MVHGLVLLDLQRSVIEACREAGEVAVREAATLVQEARRHSTLIINIRVGFRKGYPEVAESNRVFSKLSQSGALIEGTMSFESDPRVGVEEGDIEIVKRRVNPFIGTDLDLLLRARRIETLTIAGVYTSGAVLSAVRMAADLDYEVVVAREACADPDADVHDFLMKHILCHHARVLDSEACVATWRP